MPKTILYDLPSRPPCKSWSFNPMKTRMILNYKGIDYATDWTEYPDLVPKLKALGLPPNDPSLPGYFTDYTSPAIRYEDGTYGMDSWLIAGELEKRYRNPSLHLDDAIVVHVRDQLGKIANPLFPYLIPKVPQVCLNKVSADYFELTREESLGMPLSEFAKRATEESWKQAEEPMKEMAELLKKNGGPYFLGDTVSYADFIFVSYLYFMERLDGTVFQRFVSFDPAFGKLYEASKIFLEKTD